MPLDDRNSVFLVIRTVFFVLLTHVHVLILVFALWNIAVAKSSGVPTPGASVFLLMSSIVIFVLVPIAYLAELICDGAGFARVRVECAWTGLMSIIQLAASITITVDGPPTYCQMRSPWAMCASSSLLVHITWPATLIILSYCLTLCVAASAHAAYFPDIWVTPVTFVPWFRTDTEVSAPAGDSHSPTLEQIKSPSSSWSDASCALSKYIAERWDKLSYVERQSVSRGPSLSTRRHRSVDSSRPTGQHGIRRGVDDTHGKPLPKRKEPPLFLAPPPRTHPRQPVLSWDSLFIEVREQLEMARRCSYLSLTPRTPTVFPQNGGHLDLPTPRPILSEPARTDVARGNVFPAASNSLR